MSLEAETSPARFQRLDALLERALDLPPPERGRFLEGLAGPEVGLRAHLERLIDLAGDEGALAPAGGLPEAMADAPPRQIGRYPIRGLLGSGGMGVVYRAFDPTLGREVAIKVLAVADPEEAGASQRRLEREARLLATLNHPNIATIHGCEVIGGAPCLILELIEGPTLAQRLEGGRLTPAEVVAVALPIALALEEAHRKGVVHRDLKPANVKVDREGRVKVLDFGIARPVARSGGEPATTRSGAILGTVPYMSPEQARGEAVDPRTDIWAFGCLLVEMLTGRPLFTGASTAEVLAAVLRDEPDLGGLPSDLPAPLARLVRRCLRRDPRERLQHIGDARLELADAARGAPEAAARPAAGPAVRRRRPGLRVAVAAGVALAALAALAILVILAGLRGPAGAPPVLARLGLDLPGDLAVADDYAAPFAISADGTRLVVVATRAGQARLYRRSLDALEATPLAGSEGAWQPFFSPDGREVAFFADRKLKKVAWGDRGGAVALAEIGGNPRGGSWAPDGTIVFAPAQATGLHRLDPGGGPPTPLTFVDHARGEGSHRWPQVLPGGRWVLFTTGLADESFDEARLEVVDLETGLRRTILAGAAHGRYAEGRLLFARAGRLLAVRFDPRALRVFGTPAVLQGGVRYDARNGGSFFAVSQTGTLLYTPGAATPSEYFLSFIAPDGTLARIDEPRPFREPRLSPDGRRVAVRLGGAEGSDLWILDAESRALSRLSSGLAPRAPTWSPDGRRIAVGAQRNGRWELLVLSTSGRDPPVVLHASPHRLYPSAWSKGGAFLVFQELRPTTGWDLRIQDLAPDGQPRGGPRDLIATPFIERNAALSPDGRWVAYESDELDSVMGIYVAPLERPAARARATNLSGNWPRWGADGQLYFWHAVRARPVDRAGPGGLYRLDWRAPRGENPAAAAVALWPGGADLLRRAVVAPFGGFDVDPSRTPPRFLVLEANPGDAEPRLAGPVVVLNWPQTLAAAAPER